MSNEPHIFFNEVNERQGVFHRRALLAGGFATLGVLGLSVRLMQLQLVENDRYRNLSASNQFNYRLVPPPVWFTRTPAGVHAPAPGVGQDTRAVLGEAGYSAEEIEDLVEAGVLRVNA